MTKPELRRVTDGWEVRIDDCVSYGITELQAWARAMQDWLKSGQSGVAFRGLKRQARRDVRVVVERYDYGHMVEVIGPRGGAPIMPMLGDRREALQEALDAMCEYQQGLLAEMTLVIEAKRKLEEAMK